MVIRFVHGNAGISLGCYRQRPCPIHVNLPTGTPKSQVSAGNSAPRFLREKCVHCLGTTCYKVTTANKRHLVFEFILCTIKVDVHYADKIDLFACCATYRLSWALVRATWRASGATMAAYDHDPVQF